MRITFWVAVACVAVCGSSVAQDADPSSGANADAESMQEIRVTGTRLVVPPGFQSPTPMTVVDEAELEARSPTSLSDSLNQLPMFRDSHTPSSNGISTVGSVGQSFLNLRALGPARTLVLLDGRRVVPSTSAGTVDVSILPEALITRVDTVTGGVSAVYGSDAVAGVVNFVLNDRLKGIKATAQAGEAAAGDADVRKFELAGGTSLFDGRGHVVASASHYSDSGIATWRDREWFDSCARIANPALVPASIMACNVHSAAFTPGGLIPSGPLRGTEFGPGGVPRQFNYGSQLTTLTMIGGDGLDNGVNLSAVPEVERNTAFAHLTYDLSDNVSFFVEGLYGEAKVHFVPLSAWEGQTTGFTIFNDNAFLPAEIRQRMTAANITSFPLWRFSYDFGPLTSESRNRTKSGALGLEATLFGDWKLDAYYQHGENDYLQTTQNNPNINLLYNAADAIVGPDGRTVCRSTLVNPNNGCVPLNLFGPGAPSPSALDWILGTTVGDQHVEQDVFNVAISGQPWKLWAGPVSVAFGGGYRRESSNMVVDPISTSTRQSTGDYRGFPTAVSGLIGGWERTNLQPISGKYDLTELFTEALLPLLKDAPAAQSLDLSLAARITDYSTSGDVTTWKVGLTYQPITSVRLRGTVSRDIRAANISELFSGPSLGQGNLIDPFQPVGSPDRLPLVYTRPQGNPSLTPENADTRTIGVVVQPSFVPGLSVSLDFYDIEITDAIGTLSGQVIVDQCFQGATSLCSLLTRSSTGVLTAVDAPFLNLSLRKTRGYDLEMSYQKPLGRGSLALRGLASYVDSLTTLNPGAPQIEAAGQTGRPGQGGIPNLVANASAQYRSNSGYGAYLQLRYIDDGINDATLLPSILDPAQNRVSSATYTDVTLTKRIGSLVDDSNALWGAELFLTVNNVFDRDPPSAPSPWLVFGAPNGGTNGAVFDLIGRRYNAGVRVQF